MKTTLFKAIEFATEVHNGSYLDIGVTPYIMHPLKVMDLLISWGITSEDFLVPAILLNVKSNELCNKFPDNFYTIMEIQKDKFKNYSIISVMVKVADIIITSLEMKEGGKEYFTSYKPFFKLLGEKTKELNDKIVHKMIDSLFYLRKLYYAWSR